MLSPTTEGALDKINETLREMVRLMQQVKVLQQNLQNHHERLVYCQNKLDEQGMQIFQLRKELEALKAEKPETAA